MTLLAGITGPTVAQASPRCYADKGPTCELGRALQEAQSLVIPTGELSVQDVQNVLESLARSGRSAMELFALIGDGKPRSIRGEVVVEVFELYGIEMDYFPLYQLKRVVARNGVVDLQFDFGADEKRIINVPAHEQWVLGKNGKPVKRKIGANTLRIAKTVRMYADGDTVSLRTGDLEAKWIIWWDLSLETLHKPGTIHTDRKGRSILELDSLGHPLVDRNGNWVAKTADDWLVVSAVSQSIEIGMGPVKALN